MPSLSPIITRGLILGVFKNVMSWSVCSAMISLSIVLVNAVVSMDSFTLSDLFSTNPLTSLSSYHSFSTINYVMYSWVLLLIFVIIASFLYVVSASASIEGELPMDFHGIVSDTVIWVYGFTITAWFLGGGIWEFLWNSPYMTSGEVGNIISTGKQSTFMGINNVISTFESGIYFGWPYVPIVIFVALVFLLLRNAYHGWVGQAGYEEVS